MIEKIEVQDIVKRCNATFTFACSVTIRDGSLYTIVGPNGSGKSTLLKIMGLIDRPDSGDVIYHNGGKPATNPFHDINLRRRTVLVPAKAALFNESVYENAAYGLRLRNTDKKSMHEKVMRTLHVMGLSGKEDMHAYVLSSGEAQRLALVRALVLDPEALFLDEPTASLDPDNTRIIENAINERAKTSGRITVMVTHNLNQAKALADSVMFIYGGRIIEMSDAASFFKNPSTEQAQKFVFGEIY